MCVIIFLSLTFCLSGLHAGADISRSIPGKFPHHVKGRPPKDSEKGAKI